MLTLQDVGRVAEAQRRFPNWIIWAVVLVAMGWAIGTAAHAFLWQVSSPLAQPGQKAEEQAPSTGDNPPTESDSAPVNNSPAQAEPEVTAPMATLLTLRWEEYDWERNPLGLGEYDRWGKDERGVYSADENGGGIPMGEFIGTGKTKNAIVYIKDVRMITGSSETYPLQFSPDGEHWYQVANLPEVPGAQIRAAAWNGDDILIFANDAYEPWKYRHYIARVTPQDTKRASQ